MKGGGMGRATTLDEAKVRDAAVEVAAGLLETGHAAVMYAPGNGTRYDLVFVDLAKTGLAEQHGGTTAGSWTAVALLNFGTAYTFRLDDDPLESYIADKLGCTHGDGAALRELFATITLALLFRPTSG